MREILKNRDHIAFFLPPQETVEDGLLIEFEKEDCHRTDIIEGQMVYSLPKDMSEIKKIYKRIL